MPKGPREAPCAGEVSAGGAASSLTNYGPKSHPAESNVRFASTIIIAYRGILSRHAAVKGSRCCLVNYCSKMLRCTKLDLSTLHQNGLNCPTSLWRSEPCGLCALAASTPEEAIIAAVNHSVDSDSTGLITGNIVGVIHGHADPSFRCRVLSWGTGRKPFGGHRLRAAAKPRLTTSAGKASQTRAATSSFSRKGGVTDTVLGQSPLTGAAR
jgi:hypothetical protein